jgi:hypothetical protein
MVSGSSSRLARFWMFTFRVGFRGLISLLFACLMWSIQEEEEATTDGR